ncbi:hypothetical protein [Actinoplanes sp. NPDC051851]|uniref:hypothetical protein n=1 Tax=Actinoplanes sp. NPDC051851 TaxID=3154753 RepID=UPI0034404F65
MEVTTDRQLLATLCAALPALRERADAGFWSDRLDEAVGDLAGGEPVREVCRRLGLLPDGEVARGGEPGGLVPGVEGAHLVAIAEVTLDGDYRCPLTRCARRAHRDDRGRVPFCALAEQPMTFRGRQ